jgi:hypothetical protein
LYYKKGVCCEKNQAGVFAVRHSSTKEAKRIPYKSKRHSLKIPGGRIDSVSYNANPAKSMRDPLGAMAVAAENDKVLYEHDEAHILEVTIQPGETENCTIIHLL